MAEPDQKGSPLQKRWLVLAAIVVLALIFLIPFIKDGGARVDTNVVVETETAFLGEIQETTQGVGRILSAQRTSVRADYTGKIGTVEVEEGEEIQQGDVLAIYDGDDLSDQINHLLDELDDLDAQITQVDATGYSDITAEASGLVKSITAVRGDVVTDVMETQGSLMEISTDGLLQVRLTLTAETALEEGDPVTVQIDEQTEPGEVAQLEEEEGQRIAVITFADSPEYTLGKTVQVLDADQTVLGQGPIASHAPCLVTGDNGIISKVHVEVGDAVQEGDSLFTCVEAEYNEVYLDLLDQRLDVVDQLFTLQEFSKKPVLLANRDGVVTDLALQEGEEIEAGEKACVLVSTNDFNITVDIAEQDVAQVKVGQQVQLEFDRFRGTLFWGRVTKVSRRSKPVGDLYTYSVTISLQGADGLAVGMPTQATIILDSASNAVLVPVQAVQVREDGSRVVEISYADGLSKVCQVEVGLRNEDYVQILSGVREGDQVVVSSHVVETKVFSLFNFEWIIDQEEEPIQPGTDLTERVSPAGDDPTQDTQEDEIT